MNHSHSTQDDAILNTAKSYGYLFIAQKKRAKRFVFCAPPSFRRICARCIGDIMNELNNKNSNVIACTHNHITSHITFISLEFPWKLPYRTREYEKKNEGKKKKMRDMSIIIQKSMHYGRCIAMLRYHWAFWMGQKLSATRITHMHKSIDRSLVRSWCILISKKKRKKAPNIERMNRIKY